MIPENRTTALIARAGRILQTAVAFGLCTATLNSYGAPIPADKPASYPSWWFEREVIPRLDPNNPSPSWLGHHYHAPDDFGAVNAGQLRWMATAAFDELEARLQGGAGPGVSSLIKNWFELDPINGQVASPDNPASTFHLDVDGHRVPKTTSVQDDFVAVNLGQVKAVVRLFYEQLVSKGYANRFPSAGGQADDFALVNLGQLKRLFSFDPAGDLDKDGMDDAWELANGLNPSNANDQNADDDGDGLSNSEEFLSGSNPHQNIDSDSDGVSDDLEMANGLDPHTANNPDEDRDEDGLTLAEEVAAGSNPNNRDSDRDGVLDGEDAVPNDRDFTHRRMPVPRFAVVELGNGGYSKVTDMGHLQSSESVWVAGEEVSIPGIFDISNTGWVGYKTEDSAYITSLVAENSSPKELRPFSIVMDNPGWAVIRETVYLGTVLDNGSVVGMSFKQTQNPNPDDFCSGLEESKRQGTRWAPPDMAPAEDSSAISSYSQTHEVIGVWQTPGGGEESWVFLAPHYVIASETSKYPEFNGSGTMWFMESKITRNNVESGNFSDGMDWFCFSYPWFRRHTLYESYPTQGVRWVWNDVEIDKNETRPINEFELSISVSWVNSLTRPIAAGNVEDVAALWPKPNATFVRKTLSVSPSNNAPLLGRATKINNLGQAIIKDSPVYSFWQNGCAYKLEELSNWDETTSGNFGSPVDISENTGFVLIDDGAQTQRLLIPMELNSMDRFLAGSISQEIIDGFGGNSKFGLIFRHRTTGETYTFNVISEAYVYEDPFGSGPDAEDKFLSNSEIAMGSNGQLGSQQISQDVVFYRHGGKLHFRALFDEDGEVEIGVVVDGNEIGKADWTLQSDFELGHLAETIDTILSGTWGSPAPQGRSMRAGGGGVAASSMVPGSSFPGYFAARGLTIKVLMPAWDSLKTKFVDGARKAGAAIDRAIQMAAFGGKGFCEGAWMGVKDDAESLVELGKMILNPVETAKTFYEGFKVLMKLDREGWKNVGKTLVKSFLETGEKGVDEWTEPNDLDVAAYLVGYTSGFITEQIAVSYITAGVLKAGNIGAKIGAFIRNAAKSVFQPLAEAGNLVTKQAMMIKNSIFRRFSQDVLSEDDVRKFKVLLEELQVDCCPTN